MTDPVGVEHPDDYPEWLRPPYEGFTVDDLYRLTALPPHTQLLDGSLVPRSRQSTGHSDLNSLLAEGLRRCCPEWARVRREMVVVLAPRQAPEPDVCVIRAAAAQDRNADRYFAEDVLLAVETVSPDSEIRDRERKPQLYAAARIPHFWLVEMAGEQETPVVHTYALDPVTKTYNSTGTHIKQLTVDVPYRIDIDLTEIDRL